MHLHGQDSLQVLENMVSEVYWDHCQMLNGNELQNVSQMTSKLSSQSFITEGSSFPCLGCHKRTHDSRWQRGLNAKNA